MNNKTYEKTNRLLKTRQEFSQLTKSSVNKWKRIKQIKDNKRLEELQNQEIERINKQLIDLREEYKRIASERGSAHKWAQIVAKHESEVNELEERRNTEVLNRSKHNYNNFVDQNIVKQNKIQIEKQNQILKRKQLMKSSLSTQTDDKELNHILRKLNALKQSESVLRDVIKKKKDFSHSQQSIENMAEKLFWSKKLVPKQDFFDSASIDLSNGSKHLGNNLKERQTNLKSVVAKEKQNFVKSKPTEVLKMSSIRDYNSEEYLPISIATKLYERLRIHRKDNKSDDNNKKVYRNVAVSTTPPNISLEMNNDSDDIEKNSMDLSHQTSYLSVPNDPNVGTNNCAKALSNMFTNLNNRLNCFENNLVLTTDYCDNSLPDITIFDDSTNSMDPLMIRINNLKQLIDKKVGQHSGLRERESHSGDFEANVSKHTSHKSLEHIENKINEFETKSPEIVDLDAMSSSSATSFKTLTAISSSDCSSPSFNSSFQVLDLLNNEFPSIGSNVKWDESVCNPIQSNSSSIISCSPLRDRNGFWKEIFERAGIHIETNRIDDFFPSNRQESEPTVDTFASFSLSSFSTDPNSHSTPKH